MNMVTVLSTSVLDDVLTAWVEMSDGVDTYIIAVGGIDPAADIEAHILAKWDRIWQIAVASGQTDIMDHLAPRPLLKALVRLMLSEINILRSDAGLPVRTLAQLKNALKNELD